MQNINKKNKKEFSHFIRKKENQKFSCSPYFIRKKAISQIVSTVILLITILITIPIFYVVINKMVKDTTMSPEIPCPDIQINPPIRIIKSCYNQETKDNEILLSKTTDYKINLIEFTLDFDAENQNFKCDDSCSSCRISEQNSKTYYIFSEQKPKEIILRINNCEIEKRNVVNC